ncbi:YfhO family protein [Kitasatospora sp. GP82]|uniref:YfhO family protein n=1 Tax=Kitasatospora sp. GP82 TaxID=3035089 RepID=UPI002474F1CA|nr:YfhO family protein [Kitasatospora sp. GP82]MDH6128702.1 putative membrane protein YfhO [Kitasatospora sp. GP82]
MSRTSAVARRLRSPELGASGLAAALSMGAYCVAMAVHGTYPFGSRSRAVNDLANQFVPYHAHLWDLQHGNTTGDLVFNWNSGYGAPFLADFFTYLMNPFSWLVGLFPRSAVNFPVFLVTLLSIGLGAAVMTYFLGRLRPGSPWLRSLLGVGYGVCAWVLNDGSPDPMWMWGLVSLPLVGIACDWCLRERRWVLGTFFVAIAWAGNFYTGAMATIGAGLVLLVRVVLAEERPLKARLWVLGRAASMVVTGVLLAAPIMFVSLKASKSSQPAPLAKYDGAPGLTDYLAQLLPGGRSGLTMPNIFIGMLGLLLVASLPFNRRVAVRERVAWYVLLALVAVSFVWEPTILLWHGLAVPNGSPYRAAFILSGLLTMAAWVSLSRRPDLFALLGGTGLVALVVLVGHGRSSVHPTTWVLVGAGGSVTFAALWALERWHDNRRARQAVGAILACSVFAGTAMAALSATVIRDRLPFFTPKTTMSASILASYDEVRKADDWPTSRTDPGPRETASNDPMLIGGEGGSYYSSYIPATTAELLHDLGAGWYIQGRHTLSPVDPVGRALFGITTYLEGSSGRNGFTVKKAAAAPLVTVHPPIRPDAGSVWSRQESLLGAKVYDVPQLTPSTGPKPTLHGTSGWSVPATPTGSPWTTFTGSCTPGSTAFFYGPWFGGTVMGLGTKYESAGRQPMTAMPIRELGTVGADGKVQVQLRASAAAQVPAQPVGCLDKAAFTEALGKLKGATEVSSGGHTLTAELPKDSTGTALISVPAVTGWQCSVDGGAQRPVQSVLGMIGVPLGKGASRISCTYSTPGLTAGLAVGAVGLAVLLGVAVTTRLRRRAGTDASSTPVPST